jgi:hypothetical protein
MIATYPAGSLHINLQAIHSDPLPKLKAQLEALRSPPSTIGSGSQIAQLTEQIGREEAKRRQWDVSCIFFSGTIFLLFQARSHHLCPYSSTNRTPAVRKRSTKTQPPRIDPCAAAGTRKVRWVRSRKRGCACEDEG